MLNVPQVGAVFEQVRGKRMAQGAYTDFLADTCLLHHLIRGHLNAVAEGKYS